MRYQFFEKKQKMFPGMFICFFLLLAAPFELALPAAGFCRYR